MTLPVLNLVACVSKKRNNRMAAKDLYCSQWFKLARKLMEQRGEPWAILSARHGLVMPDEEIRPYDETLGKKTMAEREGWADVVMDLIPQARRYVIWGGMNYYEFLAPRLGAELPLEGLGIGQQLAYLSKLVNATPPTLLEAAIMAEDAMSRCDPYYCDANGKEQTGEKEFDEVMAKLRQAIAAERARTAAGAGALPALESMRVCATAGS